MKFFLEHNQEKLANIFVESLDEPLRTAATNIIIESVLTRADKEMIRQLQLKADEEAAVNDFKQMISNWTTEYLITWYGDHGPSSSPFNILGGEMDEYVQCVYYELFDTDRIPQEQHEIVQQHIKQKIEQRFNTRVYSH